MKVSQALFWAKRELIKSSYIQRAGLESEILLAHVMHVTREWLHTWGEKEVDEEQFQEFQNLITKRLAHTPIAYLTHSASFYSRDFYVDSSVLIPRPESELLIENLDFYIRKYNVKRVSEIGVGSGILSITLALKYPHLQITATDISAEALEVARFNLEHFILEDKTLQQRIDLKCTRFLEGIQDDFDLLISNPPYIANDKELDPDVLVEPHIALFGGENGDEILKEIIKIAVHRKISILACEMGYDQRESMQEALQNSGYKPEFYRDYAGLDRGFVATRFSPQA